MLDLDNRPIYTPLKLLKTPLCYEKSEDMPLNSILEIAKGLIGTLKEF